MEIRRKQPPPMEQKNNRAVHFLFLIGIRVSLKVQQGPFFYARNKGIRGSILFSLPPLVLVPLSSEKFETSSAVGDWHFFGDSLQPE